MDLLVIRHGQSANNLVWERTGASIGRVAEPGLTDLGHEQARRLAAAFASGHYPVRPTALYCSLMTRAVQTAAPLADALDVDLHGHLDAFEVGGPLDWDGDPAIERRHHPGLGAAQLAALSPRLRLPEGAGEQGWWLGPVEDEADAPERARRLVADLRGRHTGEHEVVAVVCHAWFAQFVLRELLGIPTMTGWIGIDNTGVSLVQQLGDDVIASWVNRLTHLESHQVTS